MLTPINATRRSSVLPIKDDWYPVCRSDELRREPRSATLYGVPLAVFRTDDGVGAVLDRCPHRGIPLSEGRVDGGTLECPYHGWRFSTAGACVHIPCLVGEPEAAARRVPAYRAREQDGYVWVYATPDEEPRREPFRFPFMDDDRYTKVRAELDLDGSIHAVAENALDVPHTAFLHGGLFRTPGRRHPIDVKISRAGDRTEAEYIGEPGPKGLLGRILAPGGGVVEHFDRFLLPSITQVEYRLGDKSHLMVTAALCPIDERKTRLFGMAAFRLPIPMPGALVGAVLRPLALYVLGQDARILTVQSKSIARFGEEQLVSTDVDVLGPHILRLLKNAAEGKREGGEQPYEKQIRMEV